MQRILIIGNAGAGKSTFSRQLAAQLNLPLVHLDKLFWNGNWTHVPREEFDVLLQAELEKPQWIIDGNYDRTLPRRLEYCDTVFFFDLPALTCLAGVTQRVFENYGKTRKDMGGSCPEYFDKQKWELCGHVLSFNRQHRKAYYEMLSKAEKPKVIIFKSRRQAKEFLQNLK